MASPEERELLLEEYRQLCDYHRHDDIIKWTILGLGYTAGGALMSVAVGDVKHGFQSVALLVVAYIIVFGVSRIYFDVDSDTRKRLRRLHDVEYILCLRNHRLFDFPNDSPGIRFWSVNTVVRFLEHSYYVVIFVLCVQIAGVFDSSFATFVE